MKLSFSTFGQYYLTEERVVENVLKALLVTLVVEGSKVIIEQIDKIRQQ